MVVASLLIHIQVLVYYFAIQFLMKEETKELKELIIQLKDNKINVEHYKYNLTIDQAFLKSEYFIYQQF